MLKARHCYANENAFNAAKFRELATVSAYALHPGLRTQVKFLIGNKETEETGGDNRFFIMDDKIRSKAFFRADAEALLKFIDIIRDDRIETYQCGDLVYDTKQTKNALSDNKYTRRYIRGTFSNFGFVLVNNENITPAAIKDDPTLPDVSWKQSLDRFEEILKAFIDACDGKKTEANPWFVQGRFLMLPLHNKHNGAFKPHSLRLNWVLTGRPNHIAFQAGEKTVLFYAINKDDTSSLEEVIEGFIDSLYRLIDAFNSSPVSEDQMFIKAIPVKLSKDREAFMEYVGGRETGGENHEGNYRGMIVNVNSDAAPAWSKVHFNYNHDFVCDLVDGLRFLTSYEV